MSISDLYLSMGRFCTPMKQQMLYLCKTHTTDC